MTYTDIYNAILAELNRSDKASMVSSWVNERYNYALNFYDFSWKYNTQVIPSVLNGWAYNVNTDFGKPKSLILDDGANSIPLDIIELDTFDRKYPSPGDDGAGTPGEAALRNEFDGTYTRTVKLLVYPKASGATFNFNLRYFIDAPTLSGVLVPIIPTKYQDILIFGGLMRGFAHLREYTAADWWNKQFNEKLAEMLDDDKRRSAHRLRLGTFHPVQPTPSGEYWKKPLLEIE